ncbi:MAG: DUF1858 domain-containing protein [Candidatus Omnitrophica bacterium]|nr:DUF1858 domain-containing protein [Candidatus Omnitrophota bacterium]
MKKININKTVFELTQEYPELIDILVELGFLGVKNPVIKNTLGRVTTLKQGVEKQNKDINQVIEILKQKGFEVEE